MIPFSGAVELVKQAKVKVKTKQIKGYKCNCGTFTDGYWTLLPYFHSTECIINKKGKQNAVSISKEKN